MIDWYPAISGTVATASLFYGIHLGRQFEREDAAKRQKALDHAKWIVAPADDKQEPKP